MAPKDQTQSPEPCDPEASQTEAPRKKRKGSPRSQLLSEAGWKKIKVFAQPEFTVAADFRRRGGRKGSRQRYGPEPWLEAAIEAGLVEMVPYEKAPPGTQWLEPKPGVNPPREMNLREVLELSIAKTLLEFDELERKKK